MCSEIPVIRGVHYRFHEHNCAFFVNLEAWPRREAFFPQRQSLFPPEWQRLLRCSSQQIHDREQIADDVPLKPPPSDREHAECRIELTGIRRISVVRRVMSRDANRDIRVSCHWRAVDKVADQGPVLRRCSRLKS
jgi:hypothetical protein